MKEYVGYDGSLIIDAKGKRFIKLMNGQIVTEETFERWEKEGRRK